MSENRLGGNIKLTVPQFRVFLASQRRWIAVVENGDNWNTTYSRAKVEGAEHTLAQLLKCLNLPPDWEGKMERLEASEASAGMTSEERAEYRKVAP